jgi:ABC-type bacteriocin/lantibiotic exporter with double-glycine peptidase domain
MENKLFKHKENLTAFNKQRKLWVLLSVFVVLAISDIIFNWSAVTTGRIVWVFILAGLLVSIVWWYWTMKIIRQLIDHRVEESEILLEVVRDIQDIKKEVNETMSSIVDRSK